MRAPTDRNGFELELYGAMFGCIAIGLASGAMGVWPLFYAYLPLSIHLALSALLAMVLTNYIRRSWTRLRSALAVVAFAAVLTITIYAPLPLYLFLHRSVWPAQLLFG